MSLRIWTIACTTAGRVDHPLMVTAECRFQECPEGLRLRQVPSRSAGQFVGEQLLEEFQPQVLMMALDEGKTVAAAGMLQSRQSI